MLQKVKTGRREAEARQGKLKLSGQEEHQIPPFDLLEAPDTSVKKQSAQPRRLAAKRCDAFKRVGRIRRAWRNHQSPSRPRGHAL
jgi:hypothetical protein